MKKLILVLMVAASNVMAQSPVKNRALHLEIDPIAYALSGYSFHAIYQVDKISFDAGIFGIEAPEGFTGNKGFRERMTGAGVKAHYHFNGVKGWFTGISAGYSHLNIKHKQSGGKDTGASVGVGIDVGYRFFFWKDDAGDPTGLYIAPWVSVDYAVYQDKVNIAEKEYRQHPVGYFPTLHIGYRFR